MVNNTVYHFAGSNLGIEIFLKSRGAFEWKTETSLYTLYWGFKKIPFTLYTYVLAKILQNGTTFMQKLTPGFKNYMKNLDNFRQQCKVQKVEIQWALFVQKKKHSFS